MYVSLEECSRSGVTQPRGRICGVVCFKALFQTPVVCREQVVLVKASSIKLLVRESEMGVGAVGT
eukprot:6128628-Amphidinium_carterae.1